MLNNAVNKQFILCLTIELGVYSTLNYRPSRSTVYGFFCDLYSVGFSRLYSR